MAWTFQRHHRLDPRVSGLPAGQDPSPHTPGPPTHPHPLTAFIPPSWIWWAYYSTVNSFNYIFTIIDRIPKWMEAIPLSETSAVACSKAWTFTWISCFGIPKTITPDRGPQFTPNFLLQLCEMLNILHRQTTAYHRESNGAVERMCLGFGRCGDMVRGITLFTPQTPRTAKGIHWSFPGWGSFWCSHCVA